MKLNLKIVAAGSLVAFAACPLAMAGKGAAAVAPEVTVNVSPDAEDVDPPVVKDDAGEEPGDEVVIHCVTDGGEADHEGMANCDKVSDHCEDPDDCEVPIGSVERGGEEMENPDVIFYMEVRGVGAPAAAKDEIVLGQDDKAALIAGKGAATPLILREKKGPVALVKKGRVFLR